MIGSVMQEGRRNIEKRMKGFGREPAGACAGARGAELGAETRTWGRAHHVLGWGVPEPVFGEMMWWALHVRIQAICRNREQCTWEGRAREAVPKTEIPLILPMARSVGTEHLRLC